MKGDEVRHVRSAITSIGFPKSLAGDPETMEEVEGWLNGLHDLLEFDPGSEPIRWTSPVDMEPGDVLFFYLTKSSEVNLKRLRRNLDDESGGGGFLRRVFAGSRARRFQRSLNEAVGMAERYSGAVFACAEVVGRPEPVSPEPGGSRRFKSRVFANVDGVHVFDEPLGGDALTDHVDIGQGAITNLHGRSFTHVKEGLASRGELPGFLRGAAPATDKVGGSDDWARTARREDFRFRDEDQMRKVLVDAMLDELKDPDSDVLEECRCLYRKKWRSLADYFVMVGGSWVPVETKRNVLAEPKLFEQIAPYTRAESFKPTRAPRKNEEIDRPKASRPDVCLVVDYSGIYIVSGGEFAGCSPESPLWKREELDRSLIPEIRGKIVDAGR